LEAINQLSKTGENHLISTAAESVSNDSAPAKPVA
jgi:hypothetical protein